MLRRQPVRPRLQPARAATASKAPGPEAILIELMLASAAAIARVDASAGVALFTDPVFRALAGEIVATARRGDTIDAATLLSRLDDATAAHIAGRLVDDAVPADDDV